MFIFSSSFSALLNSTPKRAMARGAMTVGFATAWLIQHRAPWVFVARHQFVVYLPICFHQFASKLLRTWRFTIIQLSVSIATLGFSFSKERSYSTCFVFCLSSILVPASFSISLFHIHFPETLQSTEILLDVLAVAPMSPPLCLEASYQPESVVPESTILMRALCLHSRT